MLFYLFWEQEGSELHPLPLDEHAVLFDAIVQSAKVGLRKPNPEIYKVPSIESIIK